MAKETPSGRSKGQTTRIFTSAGELDEKFWLKYLGEDFRNAVHMQVDNDNNVKPMEDHKLHHTQSNLNNKQEKRKRFVRQSSEEYKKQLPVDTLDNNNIKSSQHKKKLLIHNKFKHKIIKIKPSSPLKAMHEPIVVNLSEIEEPEHQINEENAPVVVQMPPVIYHQKADIYPEHNLNPSLNLENKKYSKFYNIKMQNNNLHPEHVSNLTLDLQNTNLYTEQIPIHY